MGEFTGIIAYLEDGTMSASSEFAENVHFTYNGKDPIEILSSDNTGGMNFQDLKAFIRKQKIFRSNDVAGLEGARYS